MPGDFEKEMSDRMGEFRLNPSPQVWTQVEAALPEEKKRRFFFWWLFAGIILLGAGSGYFITHNKNNPASQRQQAAAPGKTGVQAGDSNQAPVNADVAQNNKQPQTSPGTPIVTSEKTHENPVAISSVKNTPLIQPATSPNYAKKTVPENSGQPKAPVVATTKKLETQPTRRSAENFDIAFTSPGIKSGKIENPKKQHLVDRIADEPGLSSETSDPLVKAGITVSNGAVNAANKKDLAIVKQEPQVAPSPAENSEDDDPFAKKNGSLPKQVIDTPADSTVQNMLTKDSARLSPIALDSKPGSPVTNKKSINNKPRQWRAYVTIGISNTTKSPVGNDKLLYAASGLNSSYQPGTAAPQSYYPSNPKSGFSYAAGIERMQQLSKNWQWFASFQYNHLKNSQTAGALKDSAIRLDQNYTLVQNFYYSGNNTTYKNSVDRFGLQAGLQYTINPGQKNPLAVRAGLTTDWQFATKQLLYNAYRNIFYYSPATTHHLTAGGQFGLEWMLRRKVGLSALVHYNFTKINKDETGVSLHWQMAAVKLSVPLVKSKTNK